MLKNVNLSHGEHVSTGILVLKRIHTPQSIKYLLDDVQTEQRIIDFIPDAIGNTAYYKLCIEFYVSHTGDEEKLFKIQKSNLSTIEIDISDCEDSHDIDMRIKEGTRTRWIHHRKAFDAIQVLNNTFKWKFDDVNFC